MNTDRKNQRNPWRVILKINDTKKHLGVFASEVEAAHAYDAAARVLIGPGAPTNFGLDGKPNVSRRRTRSTGDSSIRSSSNSGSSSGGGNSGDSCSGAGHVLTVMCLSQVDVETTVKTPYGPPSGSSSGGGGCGGGGDKSSDPFSTARKVASTYRGVLRSSSSSSSSSRPC